MYLEIIIAIYSLSCFSLQIKTGNQVSFWTLKLQAGVQADIETLKLS